MSCAHRHRKAKFCAKKYTPAHRPKTNCHAFVQCRLNTANRLLKSHYLDFLHHLQNPAIRCDVTYNV